MPSEKEFIKQFSQDSLQKIYDEHIRFSGASGLDNLSNKSFNKIAEDQIAIASRKIISGTYQFTNYKLKLVSKGRGKIPREISIPTIRDRIVLRALCDLLSDTFTEKIKLEIPQNIIKKVKEHKDRYTGFIKLDVSKFYPSISHEYLNSRLRTKIRHKKTLGLINRAIRTKTLANSAESANKSLKGVPQGLSISNILAAIYMSQIDVNISRDNLYKYFRYVDDILIFSNSDDLSRLANIVINEFSEAHLEIHSLEGDNNKSQVGHINIDSFSYLGYSFGTKSISVKEKSISKLKDSFASIFTSYKYSKNKNLDFLLWRLNFRITGCILEKKCKGWLFFFSEINDESLLHKLDIYVENLITRFELDLQPKKFVRAFYQIQHHKYRTKYIPNFDSYSFQDQKRVLSEVFHQKVDELSEDAIRFRFKKYVTREARELLEDIQNFS